MKNKKLLFQKIIIILIALVTIGLLFFFFKDTIFQIIKLEKENNNEAIKDLIASRGILGAMTISIIEAMQMVVVFISAEFIQVAAGLSYPWWQAILLCDFGVIIGASIIFLLVKLLKFDGGFLVSKNNKQKIENIQKRSKKSGSIQSLMYVLFFMPIIPFGVICYYGASTKISYRRYILTCATGVIPSILSSLVVGKALKTFISSNVPIWLFILLVIVIALILFSLAIFAVNKIYFKDGKNTPDSIYYSTFLKIAGFIRTLKTSKIKVIYNEYDNIKGPHILLVNHPSKYDVFYITALTGENRYSLIANKELWKKPLFKRFLTRMGAIPKKLYYPDIDTIKGIMTSVKKGYPILMFPEARLSLDGASNPITEQTGKLIKKLNIPVICASIKGANLVQPKWRKNSLKNRVDIVVTKVIEPDSFKDMTPEDIDTLINENLKTNDFEYARIHNFKYLTPTVKGLEGLLYRCPHCGEFHSLVCENTNVTCKKCGMSLKIGSNYSFMNNDFGFNDIHDCYEAIKEIERKEIEKSGVNIALDVEVRKTTFKKHKHHKNGYGKVTITKDTFKFEGELNEPLNFELPMSNIKAIPFAMNDEFDVYYNDELFYFYPKEDPTLCTRIGLIKDILNS